MKNSQKKNSYSSVERRTKEIYISQHRNFSKDKSIFNRFLNMSSDPKTYDLPKEFFNGISVLDAGCGNTGYFEVAMANLGVANITCLDIGKDWIPDLKQVMQEYSVNNIDFIEGSTTQLPFDDNSFDFVVSNGVIMHLETLDNARLALKELARVTKPNGYLYVYSGFDSPGIMDRYIIPSLRKAYEEDEIFRNFIDNIDHNKITNELIRSYIEAKKIDNRISNQLIEELGNLFTLDSATFTQNVLQVPIQQGAKLGFDWMKEELNSIGLKNIRRVKEQYWIRNDYRKYLAPLHYFREEGLAKILYGGGHVKVICQK